MPNFFEDIGRTNTLGQVTRDVSKTVLGLRGLERQAENDRLNRQLLTEEIGVLRNKRAAAEKEEAFQNEPVRLDTMRQAFGVTPGDQARFAYFEKQAESRGLINNAGTPNAFASRRVFSKFRKDMESRPEHVLGGFQAGRDATSTAIGELDEQLKAAREKGTPDDDPKSQGIIQQRDALDKEFSRLQTQVDTLSTGREETLDIEAGKAELIPQKQVMKVVPNTQSSTGFSYVDLNNPTVSIAEAPKPRAGAEVSVTLGGKPTKPTITSIEKRLIDEIDVFNSTKQALTTIDPQFNTFLGKGRGWISKQVDKAGLGGSEFLRDFTKWRQVVQKGYLQYRKQITGVAVREDEKPELEIAAPSVENDSPTEIKAKLENINENSRRIIRRLKILRTQGFTTISDDLLAAIPLDDPSLTIVREGTDQNTGRRVVLYGDGSKDFAD